jgi:hypothetical protein
MGFYLLDFFVIFDLGFYFVVFVGFVVFVVLKIEIKSIDCNIPVHEQPLFLNNQLAYSLIRSGLSILIHILPNKKLK